MRTVATQTRQTAASNALRVLVLGTGCASVQRARLLQELGHEPCWLGFDWWDNVSSSASFKSDDRERWLAQQLDECSKFAAVVICADPDSSIDLAGRCLEAGIRAVLLDPPFNPTQLILDELQQKSRNAIVMVGCSLRFSFKLPRFHWSLLELSSARSRPRWRRRVPAFLTRTTRSFDSVYDEIDLAYSVNGPILRTETIRRDHIIRIGIEHANQSYTELNIDCSGLGAPSTFAAITAYDDGSALHILHEPMRLQAVRGDEPAQIAELAHFLECVRSGRTPCCTLPDANHVHTWSLEASKIFHARS